MIVTPAGTPPAADDDSPDEASAMPAGYSLQKFTLYRTVRSCFILLI